MEHETHEHVRNPRTIAVVQGWLYADALRPIAELDGNGTVVSQFVYGSRANVPDFLIRDGRATVSAPMRAAA
ncbi:MAG: hypothetical protein MUD01_11490 [Chloroflexaceae bacterium]|nr:hypothetical protein [Chloroflexaceae bacterium]